MLASVLTVATVAVGGPLLIGRPAGCRCDYRHMLNVVLSSGNPVAMATIYDAFPASVQDREPRRRR